MRVSQYEVTSPSGNKFSNPRGTYWRFSKEKFGELHKDNRIWWGESGSNVPRLKRFLSEVKQGVVPQTLWKYEDVRHTQEAKEELLKYVDFEHTENVLNSVKPTRLLRHALKIGTSENSEHIILDFFAGSAPLGHAVAVQNQEDHGNRKYILVQLPEPLQKDEPNVKTIADLGKSRLRKVAKSLINQRQEQAVENQQKSLSRNVPDLDLGFKVFKLDSSNIKPWDADFDNLEDSLFNAVENIKPDRGEKDLLYELLLKYGLDLSVPIEKRMLNGKTVYIIGTGALIVCLAKQISLETVESIADLKDELNPEVMRVVFKDSGFKDDVVKTNTVQILHQAGIDDVKSLWGYKMKEKKPVKKKDLTVSQVDRQNILNNPYALQEIEKATHIKGIPFEGKTVVLKEQVSAFFELTLRTIENYLGKYGEELAQNGYEVLKGNRLKNLKLSISESDVPETDFGNITMAPQLGIFDFRAFLNLAMLITESERARLLRQMILDIVIDTIKQRTGGGTRYINQRDEDFLLAWFQEENYRNEFMDALKNYVDMGNFLWIFITDLLHFPANG